MSLEKAFTQSWYKKHGWTHLLRPFLPIVKHLVQRKRERFLANRERLYRPPVPVLVVGNISVGGTGKSPMVVALCDFLKASGYRPGIISRGHGARLSEPQSVSANSLPSEVGDEPVMLAKRTACPVVVFAQRNLAIQHLLEQQQVDVIISDDGMQHYAMQRDIEIAMLDAQRGLGNGCLLPVGPLREPATRLADVDYVVTIGEPLAASINNLAIPIRSMALQTDYLYGLKSTARWSVQQAFSEVKDWHLIAGIGNPMRFQQSLQHLGLPSGFSHQWFVDHHDFRPEDIPEDVAVIMTEKDAVKCQYLALKNPNIWYLPISLILTDDFKNDLITQLKNITLELQNHE